MLEAAAHRCATVVGLDTSNFPDAMALLRDADAVVESAPEELGQAITSLVDDPQRRQALAERGEQAWLSARGAMQRCEALLGKYPPR